MCQSGSMWPSATCVLSGSTASVKQVMNLISIYVFFFVSEYVGWLYLKFKVSNDCGPIQQPERDCLVGSGMVPSRLGDESN